eukprot:CAMPEP_0206234790 /NCGR_PEP_ID=MMETSP0047_2-20121206/12782_1 /ASSEMBLY_ACC=CAM_ASM_000192 /TAXON_ID=195065 /ORGANISM="Chroomonas mesostigmatica_cf, Strain CCMP1168" /LENGTH=421 /DNA_ID=CAMNT_0053658907 /DNA_START=17 /DNA_END=1282 /DNA_ORIENTATION=+
MMSKMNPVRSSASAILASAASATSASRPGGARLASTSAKASLQKREALKDCSRLVVKVGTAVVSNSDGSLALSRMGALVEQLKELTMQGRQVLLVSSGAVGLGRQRLGLAKDVVANPANVIDRQACAACGQGLLMSTYDMMFQRMGVNIAQVLITQTDFNSRERYTALTDTLERLNQLNVIAIINENDVVTGCTQLDVQRVFSDNDKLSALVAAGSDADGLALLTDVDAVYTAPPDQPGAERIRVYTPEYDIKIGEKSTMGRGGMLSKINAARVASAGGVHTVVASGFDVTNIKRVFAGEDVGTLFPGQLRPNKRQRWLTFATGTKGKLVVKDDARQRLQQNSKHNQSVSGADLVEIEGWFGEKDVVSLVGTDGTEFARGMVQMDSKEIHDFVLGSSQATFSSAHAVVSGHDIVILESFMQ